MGGDRERREREREKVEESTEQKLALKETPFKAVDCGVLVG